MELLTLQGRPVGPGYPPYIIAEIGSNHNGDMKLCRRLVDAAKAAGADAVKFQSWSKSSLISKAEYARHPEYSDKKRHFGSLEEMVEAYQFTPAQHREIAAHCRDAGIEFLSSVFSPEEVDLLESLDVPAHKIASMDVTHHPLLKYVASTGKPVMLSTGMATLAEVAEAVDILQDSGAGPLALLHCVALYPPEHKDVHLLNILTLRQTFDCVSGFSDHTSGTSIALAAIALGACVIEKHFTMDKEMEGWDHWISADPTELTAIVREGQVIFDALGSTLRTVSEAELRKRLLFRRCIVARRALPKGHVIAETDLDYKRPGTGIGPNEAGYIVGRTLAVDVAEDHEFSWPDFC
ncbi:MAG: N-acetylneuraminate synthase family protein [Candidatus Hydrogenedentes bacterium]|nr:N-acetylneuraminate synthase family protein [Candidatus Hydrogenedentota bacterium]